LVKITVCLQMESLLGKDYSLFTNGKSTW